MKTKRTKKLLAFIIATAMAVLLMGTVASAAGTTYTAVHGGTTSFKKYLVMKTGTNVPADTFEFEIEPGTAIPAESGKMEVLAGVAGADVGEATFSSNDTTYTTTQSGDSSVGTIASGYKYAKKTVEVDFTACSFTEPGIYRYKISEKPYTGSDSSAITIDSHTYYMDVYVIDDGNGNLIVRQYVMHSSVDAPDAGPNNGSGDVDVSGNPLDDKVDGFKNDYGSHNLYVGKVVTGNQGSKDKYFKINIEVSGLANGQVLNIDLTNADQTSGTNNATKSEYQGIDNPTSMTANSSGVATASVYIQNGQYVIVTGIPTDASYEVTEDAEDYKSTEKASTLSVGGESFDDDVSGDITTDIYTGYTNTRAGIIPTGILLSATPWIILGVIVIVGIAFFAIRSRKKYDEE